MATKKARRAPKELSLGKVVQMLIGRSPASPDEPTIHVLTDHGEIFVYRIMNFEGVDIGVWQQLSSLIPDSVYDPDEEEDPDQDAEDDDDED